MDHTVIDNWGNVVVPQIVDYINSIKVPNSHTSESYSKNIKIDLDQVDPKNVQLNFDPKNHGLYLQVDGIYGKITGEFESCAAYIFCVWGKFEAKLRRHGASLRTNLDLTGLQEGNKLVPRPQLENFDFILHDDDIEITVYDSIVAWAVDLFIFFFKGFVLPGVVRKVNHEVPAKFNNDMNQLVVSTKGLYNTEYYNMGFDFSYSSVPSVSPEHLQLFFNGTIFEYPNEYVPQDGFANMHVDGSTK